MTKKTFDDDDGRTIADMSGIERQPMLLPRLPKKKKNAPQETDEKPWESGEMNRQERRAWISGAVSAAALIGAVFIAAGAIVIFLMTRL